MACQGCRKRKVRCDLHLHGSPCTNCRLYEWDCKKGTTSRRRKPWSGTRVVSFNPPVEKISNKQRNTTLEPLKTGYVTYQKTFSSENHSHGSNAFRTIEHSPQDMPAERYHGWGGSPPSAGGNLGQKDCHSEPRDFKRDLSVENTSCSGASPLAASGMMFSASDLMSLSDGENAPLSGAISPTKCEVAAGGGQESFLLRWDL